MMRIVLGLVFTGVYLVSLSSAGAGDAPTAKSKTDPAEAWVLQLGSKVFAEREAAQTKLRAMGTSAIPALEAGLKSVSPESVQRAESVLFAIRKDELMRFPNAFLADKEFNRKFDHPIWVRWAKLVGDDRAGRELFVEVLGVDGVVVALDLLAKQPERAKEIYPAELDRLRKMIQPRLKIAEQTFRTMDMCCTMGETAYGLYLGTFAGTVSKPADRGRDHPYAWDPEFQILLSGLTLEYMKRGPWVEHEKTRSPQRINRPLQLPMLKLMAASQMHLKNHRAILEAFRNHGGFPNCGNDASICLPLARMTCREDKFPANTRASSWLYLAEAGEIEYLKDMVVGQADPLKMHEFGRSDEASKRYTVLVSDLSIASQLILHGQDPVKFGYIQKLNESGRPVARNGSAYGFPDEQTRKATHEKALAFLKTAPAPKGKVAPPKKVD